MRTKDDLHVASKSDELQELNQALLAVLRDAVDLHRTLKERDHSLLVWFSASVRAALSRAQESSDLFAR